MNSSPMNKQKHIYENWKLGMETLQKQTGLSLATIRTYYNRERRKRGEGVGSGGHGKGKRPPTGKPVAVRISIRIPPDLLETIDSKFENRSKFILDAIRNELE